MFFEANCAYCACSHWTLVMTILCEASNHNREHAHPTVTANVAETIAP
jgi:hypothetical protein